MDLSSIMLCLSQRNRNPFHSFIFWFAETSATPLLRGGSEHFMFRRSESDRNLCRVCGGGGGGTRCVCVGGGGGSKTEMVDMRCVLWYSAQ